MHSRCLTKLKSLWACPKLVSSTLVEYWCVHLYLDNEEDNSLSNFCTNGFPPLNINALVKDWEWKSFSNWSFFELYCCYLLFRLIVLEHYWNLTNLIHRMRRQTERIKCYHYHKWCANRVRSYNCSTAAMCGVLIPFSLGISVLCVIRVYLHDDWFSLFFYFFFRASNMFPLFFCYKIISCIKLALILEFKLNSKLLKHITLNSSDSKWWTSQATASVPNDQQTQSALQNHDQNSEAYKHVSSS